MSLATGLKASIAMLGLAAVFAPAMDAGAAPGGGVTCEIRMVKSGGGVELKGIVHAARAASGSYRFNISNDGSGGSSDVSQGGDFALAAGESTVVGEAAFGNADGLKARLSVSTSAGTTSCRR